MYIKTYEGRSVSGENFLAKIYHKAMKSIIIIPWFIKDWNKTKNRNVFISCVLIVQYFLVCNNTY